MRTTALLFKVVAGTAAVDYMPVGAAVTTRGYEPSAACSIALA